MQTETDIDSACERKQYLLHRTACLPRCQDGTGYYVIIILRIWQVYGHLMGKAAA
jgi:hypothetical protein